MNRKDESLMMLLLLGALAFLRRKVIWPAGWVWPVPSMRMADGTQYQAVISDGVGSPRGSDIHRGVDIFYKRRSAADRPEYRAGTPAGTPGFFTPVNVPIVAAHDGTIWSVGNTARGWTVVINHGKPFASYYTHLAWSSLPAHADGRSVATGKPTPVKAGDVIGFMGADPMDPQRLRHLHFAVWHGGTDANAIDPEPEMKTWPRPSWLWTPPPTRNS